MEVRLNKDGKIEVFDEEAGILGVFNTAYEADGWIKDGFAEDFKERVLHYHATAADREYDGHIHANHSH